MDTVRSTCTKYTCLANAVYLVLQNQSAQEHVTMPPKGRSKPRTENIEDEWEETEENMPAMLKQLLARSAEQSSKLDKLVDKFDKLSETVEVQNAEIHKLKDENAQLMKEVDILKIKDNEREQYLRNGSMRVFNLTIDGDESDPNDVMTTAYNKIFFPILRLAVAEGKLPEVPPVHQLLLNGHILPGRQGQTKPVIIRFASNYQRSLVFKYKKQHFQSNPSTPALKSPSIVEDLTGPTYNKLMEMKEMEEVHSAWTMNGRIKYKLTSNPVEIKTLRSPFHTI